MRSALSSDQDALDCPSPVGNFVGNVAESPLIRDFAARSREKAPSLEGHRELRMPGASITYCARLDMTRLES